MITNINSEDRLVQQTFAEFLQDELGWDSVYAYNTEIFGEAGTLGRSNERDVVLTRDLRAAIRTLNPDLPDKAVDDAVIKLTAIDLSRSIAQHNSECYNWLRSGVPVKYRNDKGETVEAKARVIDFRNPGSNRFIAVRELKIQGYRVPHYNRRADLVCFVNGLPLVFIELKAVYKDVRAGFDGNISDYLDTIPEAFHHNAFIVVSNGDKARYGSITSKWEHFGEWKRNDEADSGSLDAKTLLRGMLAKDRLLDIVENFILFDASKSGGVRKIIARNHQVLGVNKSIQSVTWQEGLKKEFPPEKRLEYSFVKEDENSTAGLPVVKRAHPDLGRLGVFWHTQGSGKSYSMIFFAEKVRRMIPGNFTFVIMTDRDDLDDQIYRTFVGCGIIDDKTPRAGSGVELQRLLKENHRYVFSLIHKFNQDVTPESPYSTRDDIIVISDEAHRTQAGKLARNMRLALPNAAFIGFTGTPLFKHDELTRRIFGSYISRYDFKRSEEDGATVKLVYENRGEKLGLTRLDLNDRIAEKVEESDLDPDQIAKLESLLGKDYEVITADDRLDKIAEDFVDHCSLRWESGKALFVCIDKLTCARVYQRIIPRWKARIDCIKDEVEQKSAVLAAETDADAREKLSEQVDWLVRRAQWMEDTIIEIIISEGQNEVRDFARWDFDIRPHRDRMKRGFDTPDGRTVDVETAFKDDGHPFRIAIVCAMWLTGFDVECLSTLYIDKPLKAHTLMQAIARANRVYPGKDCGIIVDYNGMMKSLREALAQYAMGDDGDDDGGEDVIKPVEELVALLVEAIDATESHLLDLGFDPERLIAARGFDRIEAIKDAVDAVYTSDETKRRFEIMAREVFSRAKALIGEPAIYPYALRIDNIDAIYKKLIQKREVSDVTDILKALQRIVGEAIRAQDTGGDQAEGITVDLSKLDFAKLRDEFQKKAVRKCYALEEMRSVVEAKLEAMLRNNPLRMDYYKKYQEIIADYNREKDRATVEETFARLIELVGDLDVEQTRAVREGLSEEELALFDLLYKDSITKIEREKVKLASRELMESLTELLKPMEDWTRKEQTKSEVEAFILDRLFVMLPMPPFTVDETQSVARQVYDFVWQQSSEGNMNAMTLAM